jgi:hypothetical protein
MVNVVVGFEQGHGPVDGHINRALVEPGVRSHTEGSNLIHIDSDDGTGAWSHEIGHILGEPDHYVDAANGTAPYVDKCWTGNIMADPFVVYSPNHVPGSVDQRNIDEIFHQKDWGGHRGNFEPPVDVSTETDRCSPQKGGCGPGGGYEVWGGGSPK